jgi:hypothetical protein
MKHLRQFQSDIAQRLAADVALLYVPVIMEAERGVLGGELIFESAVNLACEGQVLTNGKLGLCCLVFCAESKSVSVQNAGLSGELSVTVRLIENKALNEGALGTGVAVDDLIIDAALILQRFSPCAGRVMTVGKINKIELKDAPHLWAWEIDVSMTSSAARRAACALPVIAESGAFDLVATCATSGAALWYSIDGSLPTPATGTLYAGAVDVEAGTFRVVAYKAGLMASDAAQLVR